MHCENHEDRVGLYQCDECKKHLCSECAQRPTGLDETFCPHCYNAIIKKEIIAKRYHLNSYIIKTTLLLLTYLIGMAVFIYVANDFTRWIGLIFIVYAGIRTGHDLEQNARNNARAILMTEKGEAQSVIFYYALGILLGIIVVPLYVIYRIVKIPGYIATIRKDLPKKLIRN